MKERQLLQHSPCSLLAILTLLASILFTQPGLDSQDQVSFPEQDQCTLAQDEVLETNQIVKGVDLLPLFLYSRLASVIQLKAKQRAILSLAPLLPDIVHVSLTERGPPLKHS